MQTLLETLNSQSVRSGDKEDENDEQMTKLRCTYLKSVISCSQLPGCARAQELQPAIQKGFWCILI